MAPANAGNISCRIAQNEVLITPTMFNKADLEPEDILKIDLKGNLLTNNGRPTSEINSIHLPIIKEKPGINAVIHAHPIYTSVFIVTGKIPQKGALAEAEAYIDNIILVPFVMPGSEALLNAIRDHMMDADILLLSNHGVVTMGSNPKEAFYRMEVIESTSKILLLSKLSGEIKHIPEKDLKILARNKYAVRKKSGSSYKYKFNFERKKIRK